MRRFLASFCCVILLFVLACDSGQHPVRNPLRLDGGYLGVSTGDCKALISGATDGEIAHWNGACDQHGLITGEGRLDLSYGIGAPVASYSGAFEAGVLGGYGRWTSGNDLYAGYFRAGKKDGHGIMTVSRNIYIGFFRDDVKFGPGAIYWSNGDSYTGGWLNDRPNGYGEAEIGGVAVAGQWRLGCLLATPSMGAGRPSEECANIVPGPTVYTSAERKLMRPYETGRSLFSSGCESPDGDTFLLCD